MKIKSIIIALFFFSLFGFWSCSEDDSGVDENNSAGCANFQEEYEEVVNALTVYSEDPTSQNCENYKNALLDFSEDYRDCSLWGANYEEAINDIESIDCSEEI
ncbi:hypothetical protein [Autumnicola musiva]|uniref:Lipoprotein n=1 Tax=Autumnicola musiva TaxID=3075589 RepID=A0ABU3D6L4_9FLAO|nr:hypothetical protein [Zunongwangia sp. F117]MDT0677173.1 hypothetical protein [Zunongwangia sp. F117]